MKVCVSGEPGARRDRALAAVARLFACLAIGLILGACASPIDREPPRHQVEDAHAGGNVLAIAADSRTGASGGLGGGLRLWRLPEGTALARWGAHQGNVTGLMFLPEGRGLLSTGSDGRIKVWDSSGRLLSEWPAGAPITSFAAADDRASFLIGTMDGRVAWWSLEGRLLREWQPGEDRIAGVALDGAARWFAAAEESGRVWRWSRTRPPQSLERPPTYARSLAFDPRDGTLVGSGWFRLFRWPAGSTRLSSLDTEHRGIINHLEFAPDAGYLATISSQTDSAVLLIDPRSGATLRAFEKHPLCGRRVALSPDGRIMMSTADDASIRFYALEP